MAKAQDEQIPLRFAAMSDTLLTNLARGLSPIGWGCSAGILRKVLI